jgi:ParB family chromosome partitioning protein
MNELTIDERSRLDQCEATIQGELHAFVRVGNALLTIRDQRLYRQGYETFEDYCRVKWNMARNYANKLISASETVANLGTIVPILPTSEAQTRPLTALPPEQQRVAWQEAVETAPGGKVTAAHVATVAEQYKPRVETVETPPAPTQTFQRVSADDFKMEPAWVYGSLLDQPATSALFRDALQQASDSTLYRAHWATETEGKRRELAAMENAMTARGLVFTSKLPQIDPPAPRWEPDPAWAAEYEQPKPVGPATLPISQRPDYDSDEWYTPQQYTDAARAVMGAIDLDPASCVAANEVVGAARFFDKTTNGLALPWSGRVWLNPPYSSPLAQEFIKKAIDEYTLGDMTQAVILVNNATETVWFQSLLTRFPVCFPASRVQFWREGHAPAGARQGQAVFYIGPNRPQFARVFSELGPVLERAMEG